jgi:hypothetical protein
VPAKKYTRPDTMRKSSQTIIGNCSSCALQFKEGLLVADYRLRQFQPAAGIRLT